MATTNGANGIRGPKDDAESLPTRCATAQKPQAQRLVCRRIGHINTHRIVAQI